MNGPLVKPGTSYSYRDAWVLATSETVSIGVWVGRPDGTPLPDNVGMQEKQARLIGDQAPSTALRDSLTPFWMGGPVHSFVNELVPNRCTAARECPGLGGGVAG